MLSARRTPQGGFTLIELVVVIVILGILAAFAIPRFSNIARDARIASLRGLAGSLRSSSALVHGMALARNIPSGAVAGGVALEGTPIDLFNGYPDGTATGITAVLSNFDTTTYGATYAAGVVTYTVLGAPTPANCSVTYTRAASATSSAVVGVPDETQC